MSKESACEHALGFLQKHEWLSTFPREAAFVWVWRKWDGGGASRGSTLKEMALCCDVQTTGCDMQELNHRRISQLRLHEATVCIFVLSQVQFDNHLSLCLNLLVQKPE